MLKITSIKADLSAQYKAEWVKYLPWQGVRFNVISARLPAFIDAKDKAARKFAKQYGIERIPDAELRASEAALVCEHLLRGWEGIDTDYSPEVAEKLLTDLEYGALYDAVLWCALKRASVDAEYTDDLAKNSDAPSATV